MKLLAACITAAALALPAGASSWTVDHDRSSLGFEVAVQGNPMAATFGAWSAEIRFDPADLGSAHARVTISLASADAGDKTRNSTMASKTWFDVEASGYSPADGLPPGVAVFETTGFRQTGDGAYEADGVLTLRDTKQPVTLPFTLTITGDEAHMQGTVALNRNGWGVGQGQYASGDPVATEVKVNIDLRATRP